MGELPEHTHYERGVRRDTTSTPRSDVRRPVPDMRRGASEVPPTGRHSFADLAGLQFDQVDDFFGVRSSSGEGDNVAVWLFPVVGGDEVHHHPGPFDAVRLDYCVLRNPMSRVDHYLECIVAFSAIGVETIYTNREINLGTPADVASVRDDIGVVADYWLARGITVGSDAALLIDF